MTCRVVRTYLSSNGKRAKTALCEPVDYGVSSLSCTPSELAKLNDLKKPIVCDISIDYIINPKRK